MTQHLLNFAQPKLQQVRLNVRVFRPSDTPGVHFLFIQGMNEGPESTFVVAQRRLLFGIKSYLAYFAIATGTLFTAMGRSGPRSQWYRIGGGVVALLSSTYMLGRRYIMNKAFDGYQNASLKTDLQDIAGHYKLKEAVNAEGNKDYFATGPSGFWVVEAIKDGQESGELVGCVGLEVHEGETVGELRRMYVSLSARRTGIAGILVRALEDHAYKHGVKSLYLTTTEYQVAAMRMYEKYGWLAKGRQVAGPSWWQLNVTEYRRHLDRKD